MTDDECMTWKRWFDMTFMWLLVIIPTLWRKNIGDLMLKNPETTSNTYPKDLVDVIFGKEHLGRAYEACATIAFMRSITTLSGMKFASFSATSPNIENNVVKKKNKLATIKNQKQTLLAYIASSHDVPEHFIAMSTGFVHSYMNEV